jgi:alkanesulfonate monooxygenase SsuD/methylene tetrahydromethanopterin reductase-like flavin-dependent oxidoreductase (luciferase family)
VISRGFVASGALSIDEIAESAALSEELGYRCFWVTVLADKTDPSEVLAAALAATSDIEVGLGLLPLDAFPGAESGRQLATIADSGRVTVALGVGRHFSAAAMFWLAEATAFRAAAPNLRIAVGSYGPRVLRAAGTVADAVLLNWMTPERVEWAVAQVDSGAVDAGRPVPRPVYVYLSAATGPGARPAIDASLESYRAYAYHRRHQAALGGATVGVVADSPADVEPALAPFGDAVAVINPVGCTDWQGRERVLRLFQPTQLPR